MPRNIQTSQKIVLKQYLMDTENFLDPVEEDSLDTFDDIVLSEFLREVNKGDIVDEEP